MSHVEKPIPLSIVAVYPDHDTAERALSGTSRGGNLDERSLDRGPRLSDDGRAGGIRRRQRLRHRRSGNGWFGGLFGLCVGAAFLVLPGIGPVVVAGPLTAALVGGIEGALAGTALGSLGAPSWAGVFPGTGDQIRDARQGR